MAMSTCVGCLTPSRCQHIINKGGKMIYCNPKTSKATDDKLADMEVVKFGNMFGPDHGKLVEEPLRPNSLPEDDAERAQLPMADGLLDYFPNALAEVSRLSFLATQQHHPDEPMHWARGKSTDHRNKIMKHLTDSGGFHTSGGERVRHSACLAWRALALLQEEMEAEGAPMSRASR